MEVRLPTENEWLSAAGGGLSSAGGGLSSVGGIRNMENPGWEWCADPFAPLDFIAANPKAVKAAGSPERTLRGKSFSGNGETKASLPPDLSSPFIRLRPVIVERE
jgi:formylglycine-generating enzyme required for sulfatase activity